MFPLQRLVPRRALIKLIPNLLLRNFLDRLPELLNAFAGTEVVVLLQQRM